MRRYTRIFALILALVTVFVLPVSADDFDNLDGWMNVLEYDTVNSSGSNTFTNSGEFVAKFYFPYQTSLGTIDAVIWSSRSFTVTNNNDDPLTVTYLGSNLYRVYGSSPNWHSSYLYLKFVVSSSASMQIKSLYMANSNYIHVTEVGTLTVGSSSYTMASSTSSVTHNFSESGISGYGQSYRAFFSSSNWKKYDYLDFYIRAWVGSLDSISCSFAGIAVPCSYSYIASDDWEFSNYYNLLVRVDVRGLDRSKTDVPMLLLSGVCEIGDEQFISLTQVNGYVVTDPMSPLMYYFTQIQSRLDAAFADQMDFYVDNLAALQQIASNISSGINTLSMGINSMSQSISTRIDTFRGSMESYLEELPARIAEEIAKIFRPSEGKMEQVQQESQELAQDRLGAVYQATQVIDQVASAFTVQTTQGFINIPVCSVMLSSVPFEFGGWNVQIIPDGFGGIVETLKYVIDIVCTLAFINGLKRRLEGVLGGESGVD